MKDSTNISKYRRLAPVYDILMASSFFMGARRKAFQLLNLKASDKVLLVGVGTGIDLLLLPDNIFITGVDLSEKMLAKARERIKGRNTELYNMNAEKLDFPDASFDYVVLNLILSVVENPRRVTEEAIRVLKPGGRILVFDKFAEHKVSLLRKILNKVTSVIGTDITRCFDVIIEGLPLTVLSNESSLFRGNYRIILLAQTGR